jgi:hypothetical protein
VNAAQSAAPGAVVLPAQPGDVFEFLAGEVKPLRRAAQACAGAG